MHRRRFLGSLAAASLLPLPTRRASQQAQRSIEGKDGLIVLNERPVNVETPVTLLDDDVTPNHRHFVRNNGLVPERARTRNLTGWSLRVDGEVKNELSLDLDALKSQFEPRMEQLLLECGGNGRAGFRPPAAGNQWKLGAVGCAMYTGVRLKDVLDAAGLKASAAYVAYYGEDPHLSGSMDEVPISRGVPIEKALSDHTLLAWEMNGEPLPAQHGFPLRLVAPGFPASASGKWLRRLWVRDRVHDGPKMGGLSYRVPRYPVAPGTDVPEEDMEIIETMPVKSIITAPASGIEVRESEPLHLRGHAWTGEGRVATVHLSTNFGSTWTEASLDAPRNDYAWQRWRTELRFQTKGHYEVWARATDDGGRQQPMVVPGWNPRGYLNNAMQRIAVKVV